MKVNFEFGCKGIEIHEVDKYDDRRTRTAKIDDINLGGSLELSVDEISEVANVIPAMVAEVMKKAKVSVNVERIEKNPQKQQNNNDHANKQQDIKGGMKRNNS